MLKQVSVREDMAEERDIYEVVRVLPFNNLFFFLNKNRLSTNYVQNIMLGIKEK